MGAHLLHQDDQYSFQVIAKTIDTVIPPLITVQHHYGYVVLCVCVSVCTQNDVHIIRAFL